MPTNVCVCGIFCFVSFFLSRSCCCGRPTRCLKSWRTSSDSFTKPCTRCEPTSTATATLWDYWTWPRRRYGVALHLCLRHHAACVRVDVYAVRLLPGVLWHLAGADGGAGAVFWPRHSWRQGTLPSFSATSAAAAAACTVDINAFQTWCLFNVSRRR